MARLAANPRQLNRYVFYTVTGWTRPYSGDVAILPSGDLDDRAIVSSATARV